VPILGRLCVTGSGADSALAVTDRYRRCLMFVLGFLVLAAAVAGGVELVLANRQPVVLSMWDWTWHIDAFWIAVIGVGFVVLAGIGLGAARLGLRHTRRLRRERRELAAENARLAERARSAEATRVARPVVAENRPTVTQPAGSANP
jgi:hypothetical protein